MLFYLKYISLSSLWAPCLCALPAAAHLPVLPGEYTEVFFGPLAVCAGLGEGLGPGSAWGLFAQVPQVREALA